jgi:hypothetical protein
MRQEVEIISPRGIEVRCIYNGRRLNLDFGWRRRRYLSMYWDGVCQF